MVFGGPCEDLWRLSEGAMGSPGTVLRGVGRVPGGPQRVHGGVWDGLERISLGYERVHGVPKLEIL